MSRSTSTVRESSRVFLGGIGFAVLAVMAYQGYFFRPIVEPVALAIAGPEDGKLGSGEFADLLAKMLTGALWAFGEIIWVALTVGFRFTRFLVVGLIKWGLSFTDAGREYLEHLQDDADAEEVALSVQKVELAEDPRIPKCVSTVNAMVKTVNQLVNRSNKAKESIASMQEQITALQTQLTTLEKSKSFAAWQKSLAPESDE